MKRAPGRPTKLSPEVQTRICRCVAMGNAVEVAAALAGIGRRTVFLWISLGERDRRGPYHDFAVAYRQAQAQAEVRDIERIRAAAARYWQAAAWLLERGPASQRWGRKITRKHAPTEKNGGSVAVCMVAPTRQAEISSR